MALPSNSILCQLGWSGSEDTGLGRVVSTERGWANVLGLDDARVPQLLKLSQAVGQPVVGDWVLCSKKNPQDNLEVNKILNRTSLLQRRAPGKVLASQPIAANIDIVGIVTSVGKRFNINKIERYVISTLAAEVTPIVIVNKIDKEDPKPYLLELKEAFPTITAIAISAKTGEYLPDFISLLKTRSTVVFVGDSGVGKSTLTNVFVGLEIQPTGLVRDGDAKGRHTTTRRELFITNSEHVIVDTPGMREFGLWNARHGLNTLYQDMVELEAQCKFSDCKHLSEPGCAVKEAISSDSIPAVRLENYRRLSEEIEASHTTGVRVPKDLLRGGRK